jgi:hypothetical protein
MENYASDTPTQIFVQGAIDCLKQQAIQKGCNLVLPVRKQMNNTYFSQSLITIDGAEYEPSFWGENNCSSNSVLANKYLGSLASIQLELASQAEPDAKHAGDEKVHNDPSSAQQVLEANTLLLDKKERIIQKLNEYIDTRKNEIDNYSGFFSKYCCLFRSSYNDKQTKLDAAGYALNLLRESEQPNLGDDEKKALKQGRLGKIVTESPEIQRMLKIK